SSTKTTTSSTSSTGTQPSNFALVVTPSSNTVTQGGNGSAVVSVLLSGGSPSSVSLSATGVPPGLSLSFSPSSGHAGFVSIMSMSASNYLAPGGYPIAIIAQSSQTYESVQFYLNVKSSPPSSYTLTVATPT